MPRWRSIVRALSHGAVCDQRQRHWCAATWRSPRRQSGRIDGDGAAGGRQWRDPAVGGARRSVGVGDLAIRGRPPCTAPCAGITTAASRAATAARRKPGREGQVGRGETWVIKFLWSRTRAGAVDECIGACRRNSRPSPVRQYAQYRSAFDRRFAAAKGDEALDRQPAAARLEDGLAVAAPGRRVEDAVLLERAPGVGSSAPRPTCNCSNRPSSRRRRCARTRAGSG